MDDKKHATGCTDKECACEPVGGAPADEAPGTVDAMKAQLDAATAKAAENWDSFLRARAELENYRRNMERDRDATIRRGKKDVFLRLLDVRDNLERALSPSKAGTLESLVAGVEIILRQIDGLLKIEGIEPIVAVGQAFDPALHEAVASWETPDVTTETCTDEVQKGFRYQGELLRAARVRVGRPTS